MVDNFYPPHSRLFVACDKETTEQELIGAFQFYGSVENVNLCRDRSSGAPKGFAFIQFDKTSEAAAALEGLNGTTIGRSSRPLKVSVALSKDQSSSSSASDPSQFFRLFLVVPKTATENELREYFSQFGDVDTVSIVKDRETRECKGFAYVKFRRFSHAAKAYENCDRSYRVVFAKPKDQTQGLSSGGRFSEQMGHGLEPIVACTHIDENPDGYTCLRILVSANLTDEQIEWLFDIPPGLEFVRFFNEPPFLAYSGLYVRKVLAQYDSPGTAAYALRKLDGFEYPAGEKVDAQPDYHSVERGPGRDLKAGASARSVASLVQQVESLTKSLSEATKIIASSSHGPGGVRSGPLLDAFRCSAKLPPPQPLAPPNTPIKERLFMVCEPGLPPQEALWDVFSRFGNMIDLHILNGKNCGYVKYADKASAMRAMQTLNGQDLYRMKMKVMIAEPQEPRKRPRAFDD